MQRVGARPGDLVREVPAHPVSVSRWQAGEVPAVARLCRMADYLGVDPGWLKTGVGEPLANRANGPATAPESAVQRALREAYLAGYEIGRADAIRQMREADEAVEADLARVRKAEQVERAESETTPPPSSDG